MQPAWSPDGTRIAFAKRVGSEFHIFTMNADGTGQVDVTGRPRTRAGSRLAAVGPNSPPDCSTVRATPVLARRSQPPPAHGHDLRRDRPRRRHRRPRITGVTQDERAARRPPMRSPPRSRTACACAPSATPTATGASTGSRSRRATARGGTCTGLRDRQRAQGQPARSTRRRRATTRSGRNRVALASAACSSTCACSRCCASAPAATR